MIDNVLCFEVRGDMTIQSVAECLSALNHLLAELGEAVGEGSAIDWQIWEMDATSRHFGFQTDPVRGEAAGSADRVAIAYLDVLRMLGLGRPTGMPQAVENAALDLLAAVSKAGGDASFSASGFWLDVDLASWSDGGRRGPFPVSGKFDGAVLAVCDGDTSYAVVGDRQRQHEYRCYLSEEQFQEAQEGLDQAVQVSGPLIFEPDCAAQVSIRPVDRFDVVGSARMKERFQARRAELGLSGVALGSPMLEERPVGD